MDLGIAGKNALVTGGSRGLGRQCAVSLASEGVNVAICGRTEQHYHWVRWRSWRRWE